MLQSSNNFKFRFFSEFAKLECNNKCVHTCMYVIILRNEEISIIINTISLEVYKYKRLVMYLYCSIKERGREGGERGGRERGERERGDRGRERGDRGRERGDRGRERGDRGRERGDRGRERGIEGGGIEEERGG